MCDQAVEGGDYHPAGSGQLRPLDLGSGLEAHAAAEAAQPPDCWTEAERQRGPAV